MPGSTISELAASIAANTALVSDFLSSKNIPTPSFTVDAPSSSQIPSDALEIEAARVAVIDDTLKLRDLMLGPRDYLMTFTHDELISQQAICRFKLMSAVPVHGQSSYADIAAQTGISEQTVRRLLRHAMTKRLFCEPQKGIVAHTAASRLLAEDSQLADWVGASTDDLWQAAAQTVNAMVKFPRSQEPNETGFALANNSSKDAFSILGEHPDRALRFRSAMKAWTEGSGYDLKYLVESFPWQDIGDGTVVDVGGSNGFVCTRLAAEFPGLHFVVQDLEPVIHGAEAAIDETLRGRIRFMPYNFLKERQPVPNAELYFFRWIFHNWSDKYCKIILQNLIPALKPGARIVIMDNVLPEPGILPLWQEERLRSMDLTMMEMQNSLERGLDEWEKLFSNVDSRFKFKGGTMPKGSRLWILEVQWDT
ncbi:MAG: hypothetical protein M1820_000518 [Bogoriella megaspora]|nr:MAG: hypothetical protein M1820_000518 [Bogoriella megaspora]